MRRKGLLLDRDGTIIVDHGYVGSVDRVQFVDGAVEAIAAFNRAAIPIALVSNQAGVARGYYGVGDVLEVHRFIAEHLVAHGAHIDLFLFCPYHPDGTVEGFARSSADRKPEPGLALAAAQALDLDLTSSCVVGDRPEDMGLAAAVGAHGVAIGPGLTAQDGDCWFPSLAEATEYVIGRLVPSPADERLDFGISRPVLAKFPTAKTSDASTYCNGYLSESFRALSSMDLNSFGRAAGVLLSAYERGATVFSCGNGGSASIANHLHCDHLKGIRSGTDLVPRVVSLATNIELITAIANDISYEDVFAFQLESLGRTGDVLVAISSSGRSANIRRALSWANDHGIETISLTGFNGGDARRMASVAIHIDSDNYGVVEDAHQSVMHALAQFIRQSRMTSDAVAAETF